MNYVNTMAQNIEPNKTKQTWPQCDIATLLKLFSYQYTV